MQPPQVSDGKVDAGARITRMRRLSNGESTVEHRYNHNTVNPYQTFTVHQALQLPQRDFNWEHGMRYHIQKVEDNLYIGPWAAAKDIKNLFEREITHIMSVVQASDQKFMKAGRAYHGSEYNYNGRKGQLSYLELQIDDRKYVPVVEHIKTFMAALEETRRDGGNLLVYCLQGISQSPTLVIGYLMVVRRWVFVKSYRFLHSIRCCIHPNEGFIGQLVELEKLISAQDHNRASGASQDNSKRKAEEDDMS